jgi:hypothetical protein
VTYAFASLEIDTGHQILNSFVRLRRTMNPIWLTCCDYGRYYVESLRSFWGGLRPGSYTMVLLGVWFFGFLLMKSGIKRY